MTTQENENTQNQLHQLQNQNSKLRSDLMKVRQERDAALAQHNNAAQYQSRLKLADGQLNALTLTLGCKRDELMDVCSSHKRAASIAATVMDAFELDIDDFSDNAASELYKVIDVAIAAMVSAQSQQEQARDDRQELEAAKAIDQGSFDKVCALFDAPVASWDEVVLRIGHLQGQLEERDAEVLRLSKQVREVVEPLEKENTALKLDAKLAKRAEIHARAKLEGYMSGTADTLAKVVDAMRRAL